MPDAKTGFGNSSNWTKHGRLSNVNTEGVDSKTSQPQIQKAASAENIKQLTTNSMKTDKPIKAKTNTQTAAKATAAQPLNAAPARQESVKVAPVQAPTATAVTPLATARRQITSDLIAVRAYSIWEQEGRPQGHDVANWLLAEKQLRQEQSLTA